MRARAEVTSGIKLGHAELTAMLQKEPRRNQQRFVESAEALLDCINAYAKRGAGLLSDVLGRHAHFEEWAHYPMHDAVDTSSGYRYYYHAHEARQRIHGEHGHFHVFGPVPKKGRRDRPSADGIMGTSSDYTHIIGISVDDRGFPLRLFTTNQWVTNERWLPARLVIETLHQLDLSHAKPTRLSRWVEATTRLFSLQIAALLYWRDVRIESKTRHIELSRLLADRRTHILSQCRIDLASQFQLLEGAGIG